ncbi:hypothetical protein [Sphingobacterium detergens]|uniref:hypothetical protein n=1 Tax=Sphingobacterium detergens TaxID=1145106 RepID=UPI003AB0D0DC
MFNYLSKIGDYSINDIRKILNLKDNKKIDPITIANKLSINSKEALKLISFLKKDKYIIEVGNSGLWINSIKGNYLVNIEIPKLLSQQQGGLLVTEAIDRIKTVNSDDKFLYNIIEAHLATAYLSHTDLIEKLVIYVKFAPKTLKAEDVKKYEKINKKESKRINSTVYTQAIFSYVFILDYLKSGKHLIYFDQYNSKAELLKERLQIIYKLDQF